MSAVSPIARNFASVSALGSALAICGTIEAIVNTASVPAAVLRKLRVLRSFTNMNFPLKNAYSKSTIELMAR